MKNKKLSLAILSLTFEIKSNVEPKTLETISTKKCIEIFLQKRHLNFKIMIELKILSNTLSFFRDKMIFRYYQIFGNRYIQIFKTTNYSTNDKQEEKLFKSKLNFILQ